MVDPVTIMIGGILIICVGVLWGIAIIIKVAHEAYTRRESERVRRGTS